MLSIDIYSYILCHVSIDTNMLLLPASPAKYRELVPLSSHHFASCGIELMPFVGTQKRSGKFLPALTIIGNREFGFQETTGNSSDASARIGTLRRYS